jgi:hypothetical protein
MSKIHTTIGVYPDGSHKANGVAADLLEQHIEYNKTNRPGRALLVDGKCVNKGYFSEEQVKQLEEKFKDLVIEKDTRPYC